MADHKKSQDTRICFIVNPAANRDRAMHHIEWLRQEASKRWKNHELVVVDKRISLTDLARSKSDTYDIIVACGGDGTISQIVNGLVGSNAALGVLPVGSGNDFVKSLHLNRPLEECLEIIYQENISTIDLIRYEGDKKGWCSNTIGLGVDGLANYYAHQSTLRSRIRYYVGALRAILTFRGCSIEIQSEQWSETKKFAMVTVCNGKWEGGNFLVAPDADMKDGVMNILLIKKTPLPLLILYLLRFRWGPANWMQGIIEFKTEKIEISASSPVAVHRDGEHLSLGIQNLTCTVKQNALKILLPNVH